MPNTDVEFEKLQMQLDDLTAKIEKLAGQLDGTDQKPHVAERVGERTKHAFDVLAEFIEEHPMRATVMAFLLGAVLFRGRH